ncbi:BURP domain protein RD22-like [Silene latifolia]|uniref:BURP domain protein RD22-like n=1 Tax=Silene latifolia TaxID=37657 RepID=UPI003D7826E8
MEFRFRLVSIFAFFIVALVLASHAAPSTEEYWKKLLPNTPIPKTIQDSLQSGTTGVTVGNHGVDVNVGKPGKGGPVVTVGGPKRKHPVVYVNRGKPFPFRYKYAATQTQLHDNPNVALFLVEKDLKPRTQINMQFIKSTNDAPFLPRPIAESIPFSSEKMTAVYHRFDVTPGSNEAEIMKETLKECETKGIKGEEKHCVTSLESMLDYVTSNLGNKVALVTNSVEKETKLQKYVIKRVKYVSGSATMICHKMNYAYGVFYCHKTDATKTYKVSLVGVDGTKVDAAVICHTNTSTWNPKHLAFQVLKVKPGTTPICHFLPEDHIIWISK